LVVVEGHFVSDSIVELVADLVAVVIALVVVALEEQTHHLVADGCLKS